MAGQLGAKIAALSGLEVIGILTHAGHAHDVTAQPEIEAVARREAAAMSTARDELERQGIRSAGRQRGLHHHCPLPRRG